MTQDGYFFVVDGQTEPLKRIDSVRFVTPARNHAMPHVAARLARSTRLSIDTDASRDCLVVRGDSSKLEEIRTYSDVQCTRSAFLDRLGHELVLTDDVMVCFSDELDDDARKSMCEKFGGHVISANGNMWKFRTLDVDDDAPLLIANRLNDEKGVVFAEPNALRKPRFLAGPRPTDTNFDLQWHLDNTGQANGMAGADVKVTPSLIAG